MESNKVKMERKSKGIKTEEEDCVESDADGNEILRKIK